MAHSPTTEEGDRREDSQENSNHNHMHEYYLAYEDLQTEPDYRIHGQATLSLADGTNSSEKLSVARSAYAHPGPVSPTQQARTAHELQKSHVFEGGESTPTPQSTHKGLYVAHPISDLEPIHPPKPQVDLSMPNVDPKDSYSSSYKTSHTGESPAPDDVAIPSPNITFQSRVLFEDGEKNRVPHQSTQKDNYVAHAIPDYESHSSPKPQVDLSMPNVDPKDTYQSSYNQSHKGEQITDEEIAVHHTAFESSLILEDLENEPTPQSTQRGEFVAHAAQEVEVPQSRKPQVDLTMPHVDSKDSYHSSYSQSHTGERPSADDEQPPVPRTAFISTVLLEGGGETTPLQSTQKGSYIAHPVSDAEPHPPPSPQLDLSMPNVDPKDSYHSSYRTSHTGETPSEDDRASPVPSTVFQSSVYMEDGEKNRTPTKSTQKENYVSHPVQEITHATPPKPQVSLSMPNVDPKETFHSSYETLHTGETPSEDDRASPVPSTVFQSSVYLEDGEKNRTPTKSTQKDNYVSHPAQEITPPTPPKPQVNLSMPNVDPKETFHSSYETSHTGEPLSVEDLAVPSSPTTFRSRVLFEDGSKNRTLESTQKGEFVAHPVQDQEIFHSPKPQVDLSMPNVDPKDSFQSSYKHTHKGEKPTQDEEFVLAPRTAFKSSVSLEDADKNRTPRKSTQKENYVAHPTPEIEHHTPPKPQISLTQPNVDPKDTFQSSYKQLHKGEALAPEDEAVASPNISFKSSFALEDGYRPKTPQKSTQKENYVAHPTPDVEHHTPPKPQISLTQPNVDPKETFQSSYKQLHKGEALAPEDEAIASPNTSFKSSFALEDGSRPKTPQKSTQRDNYVAHPTPDVEHHTPPKPQISLSQPNVNSKETFQSSYKHTHTGEAPSSEDEVVMAPRTTFKSSVSLEDGDKTRTPRKSTQKETYVAHPTPEKEHHTPPKPQISLTQPNVDPKESFQSSYKRLHTGEAPSAEDEVVVVPPTTFRSSVAFDDGEKLRTPQKSTQQDYYVAHPIPDAEPHHSRVTQVDLTMPHVNAKESFQSSYKNTHKGEQLAPEDEPSPAQHTALVSNFSLEEGYKIPQSTQKGNYVNHPTPKTETPRPPKPQVSLTQPNVTTKDTFQSSYKNTHRGESPAPDASPRTPPRSVFKSSISLADEGRAQEPLESTSKHSYAAPVVDEKENTRNDARRSSRSNFTIAGNDTSPRASTSASAYARPPQEATMNGSPSKPTKTALDSSLSLGDKEKNKHLSVPTSREGHSPRLSATQNSPTRSPRPSTASQISLAHDQTSYFNTTSSSSSSSSSSRSPQPPSPARKTGDLHKSSIQFSSGEPTQKISTTSHASYASPPPDYIPPRSPTPTSPYKPSPSSSSSSSRSSSSSFSFGDDQPTYQTTSRTTLSPPSSPSSPSRPSPSRTSSSSLSPSSSSLSPSSLSPSFSPSRSPTPTAMRQSQLRSSFSLG